MEIKLLLAFLIYNVYLNSTTRCLSKLQGVLHLYSSVTNSMSAKESNLMLYPTNNLRPQMYFIDYIEFTLTIKYKFNLRITVSS